MSNLVAGTLLIAEPFLKDPNFLRTVVLLCEHQQVEGSFGFIINKETGLTLADYMNEMEDLPLPVFLGGPVENNTLHFLHCNPKEIPGGQQIIDGVYWGGDFEMAIMGLRKGLIKPHQIRFYLGYSGWSEGQLEEEMEDQTWLTVTANMDIIFHTKTDDIWKASLKLMGSSYEGLANYPIDPQLN